MASKRMMHEYLQDGQQVRHIEKLKKTTWEGVYDKKKDVIKTAHGSRCYSSLTAFAVAHYKAERPERSPSANGWKECESLCKVTNTWNKLQKKQTITEIIQNLQLKIADFEKREFLQTEIESPMDYFEEEEVKMHYSISEIMEMSNQKLIHVFKKITGTNTLPCAHCHCQTVELERFVDNIRKCCQNKKNNGLCASIKISKTCDYMTSLTTKRSGYYRLLKNTSDPEKILKIKEENKHLFGKQRRVKIIRTK
jgi:Fe-S cluster biosynthesis and repair protein YggX